MYEVQLQWIRDIHAALRSPWMDLFFKGWNYVDTGCFQTLAVALIWYLWNRSVAIRLFFLLILNSFLIKCLKIFFDQPRPCHDDPLVGILCNASPGLPSGAASQATIYCGLIFIECQKPIYRFLGLIFALFLCFSRIYLGVHYFTDILGGIATGLLLLIVYKKVFPLFEKKWKTAAIGFSLLILFLPFVLQHNQWTLFHFFITSGVTLGLLSDHQRPPEKIKSLGKRLWRTIFVMTGLVVIFLIGSVLPTFKYLWFFLEGYWVSFLGARLLRDR